jgi:hypothetical protein
MAIAFVQEFAIVDRSTANYDFVKEQLGDDPIDGLIIHTAGFDDDNDVFRIFDVWESREHADRFLAERIQPMIDVGPQTFPNPDSFAPPTREGFYELHDLVKP